MSDSKIRGFLAIDLIGEDLILNVLKFQEELKKTKANIKYVEKENLHFTLKFFGDIDEETISNISNIVKEAIKDFKPINIEITGSGTFPNPDHIKTIWLGIAKNQQLLNLQKSLDEKFKKLGFKKEKKYVSHLTVGRMKNPKNKREVKEVIQEFKNFSIGKMTISKISLKKSELTPKGPIYSDLKLFEL
ncbi:MAG: RNA 2',3'-cyclic phosphodiesterase [Methanobrevibacter sp.]|jgi:2'-5' RNA ligase|nr:RNA 2',3'-cyclic phosphodiesterase [Methanobrevibacter sp.]